MKHISDAHEQDVAFGQVMVTLRTALGLTQSQLADLLGVSRRAISGWEAGGSYPKTNHLKHLIAIGVQQQIFPARREAEEIGRLWKAAHQKVQLDEQWLQTVLGQASRQDAHPVPFPDAQGGTEGRTPQAPAQPAPGPRVDWGEALAIQTFYGREQEMEILANWIVQEHCRVISVLGMGGIGKSALVVRTMYHLTEQFEVVIFRSLRDAPSCEALLDACLQVLSPQSLGPMPATLEQRLTLLLGYLNRKRTLLVLDNLESLLDEKDLKGRFRPGFEGYERLLRRIAQTSHQSCLLLTSREKAGAVRPLESRQSPVRSLRLSGLDVSTGEQILAEKGVIGTVQDKAQLIELYAGNPLALRIVSEIIKDLFGGDLASFLAGGAFVFGTMTDLLDEQWARLSRLEQGLLRWLAIVREPATLEELQAFLLVSEPREVLDAVDSLYRRSLIERGQRSASFTLQSVVLEYVTAVLIDAVSEEILQGQLDLLIQHGLELTQSREDIRQTQERLLLLPILAYLRSRSQRQINVDDLLLARLEQLRQSDDSAQGYGPANLVALLRLQSGHLRGLDLSQLVLRGVYLQGVEMQDARLCRAMLRDSTFTEAMHAIWSVAISRTGTFWAAGSWRGEVRVWCEGGLRLYRVWQAHSDPTFTLAFSPDEHTLATGSLDGTVKLWDLQSGALLWIGSHTDLVYSVVFSPDGRLLASGGKDGTVRFWKPFSGKLIQTLESPGGAVDALAWSPNGQQLAAGCWDGSVRLWQVGSGEPGSVSDARALVGHSHWVHGLAFAPDGTRLVTGSWDGTVKLWDVANERVLHTLTGHTQPVNDVAWSPDGATVASAGADNKIWLWDVAENRYRAVLHGHRSTVYRLAFTPESQYLLSGSEDRTIRVWEVCSGECVRLLQGYAICVYDLDWSPQSTHLVSGSTDGQVLQWEVTGEGTGRTLPRVLGAHQWVVFGVAWGPDGRLIASSGWDNSIRVWDATAGTCLQILRNPDQGDTDTLFYRVVWSPDGRLLVSGTYRDGLHVWNVKALHLQVLEGTKLIQYRHIAWCPGGTLLAGGSTDGRVCLWDIASGTLQQQMPGYHGVITGLAWSPDGTRLVSAGGGKLMVWEAQSGACLQDIAGHCDLVSAVAWDQSGAVLISGGSDGMLRWWEVQHGECLRVRQAHEGTIWTLKRSPDGRWLASGGDDGAIRIWDVHTGELVQSLRRDRPYERLDMTGIRGLNEAQKATLRALGAVEDTSSNETR
jgi:WD40 repeat protein/transcriptional regulator with XRE-family HTH domain